MKNIINEILTQSEERLSILVLDMIALVEARIKNKGTTAKDGFFSKYTSQYSRTRSKAGLQTSFKDFTFSNTMWRDFDLLETRTEGSVIVNDVGFRTPRSSQIYDYNAKREKISIIEPSDEEMDLLSDSYLEWFANKVDEYGKDGN